ncbi:MAG: hypothetical protein SFX19_08175 [Alphaproteobacteria bacterium]|nr:hypothetical protein [Alphaproteobacteria bacterium]
MILWPALLLLFTLFIFILPLIPGVIEMVRRTDVEPLRVSQAYDSNPFHFAEGFRTFIRNQLGDVHSAQTYNGRLPDGAKYQLIGEKGVPNLESTAANNKLILSAHSLTLPAGELFEMEVYGAQDVLTGERSQFRALLADGALRIRENCTILRWTHSNGEMAVGRHSKLFGRATSNHSIILGDDVQFERLHAPRILTSSAQSSIPLTPAPNLTMLEDLSGVKIQSATRWVLKGGLDFPARYRFTGDIVAQDNASIGDQAHIKGSIKCNAPNDAVYDPQKTSLADYANKYPDRFDIGNKVHIEGSVVSSGDLFIGEQCKIMGPVIAEGLLVIGAGSVIGSPEHPTTVTAPHIIIESGCIVHGTLWATESGVVRAARQEGMAA